MKTQRLKTITRLTVCAALIVCLLSCFTSGGMAFAYDPGLNYDKTDVMDDLTSSTDANGRPFNIADYPIREGTDARPEIMNFVEYCYSYRESQRGNYGLYIYIYNPQLIELDTASRNNRIQIAVKQAEDGTPADYEKFELQFLSVSTGDYARRFYKFKVIDRVSECDGLTIAQRVSADCRRYDVSGIELVKKGSRTAKDYPIGGTYRFTGYAKGYGPDTALDTLSVDIDELETLSLDVRSTFFRTGRSDAGWDYTNALNSVYFSVPNRFLQKYGRLQRVKAEWWEYKTGYIWLTDSANVYTYLNHYAGEPLPAFPKLGPISIFFKEDFSKSTEVSGERLLDYIYNYKRSYKKGKIEYNDLSADLFIDTVDKGHTRGYNVRDFDAGDNFDMMNFQSTISNVWQYFWKVLFHGTADFGKSYTDIAPIYKITSTDMAAKNADMSESLMINPKDAEDLRDYYDMKRLKSDPETTFLFRFAATDYYSKKIVFDDPDTKETDYSYLMQQTVFLGFDILQLTFYRDGVYKVIPAVSNPIDIVNDVKPHPSTSGDAGCGDMWGTIATVGLVVLIIIVAVLGLMLFVFLWPFITAFFKAFWAVVSWPFKKLSGAIRNRKNGKGKGKTPPAVRTSGKPKRKPRRKKR